MKKTIIKIDKDSCIGCGACVSRCAHSALQLIDGKAVLANENHCDGLGNCIGECPVGAITFEEREVEPEPKASCCSSQFATVSSTQFPVQLRLVNSGADFLKGADLLLAADCTAFVGKDFHSRFRKGKALAIACPKLDNNTQLYADKLTEMMDVAQIATLTVLIMEVPCCGGLRRIAEMARTQAARKIPITIVVMSVNGDIIREEHI
jgi:NAD-dependent dihydropyrimidine dehydrogenase PreA subunit